jgi:hypothetical protein
MKEGGNKWRRKQRPWHAENLVSAIARRNLMQNVVGHDVLNKDLIIKKIQKGISATSAALDI